MKKLSEFAQRFLVNLAHGPMQVASLQHPVPAELIAAGYATALSNGTDGYTLDITPAGQKQVGGGK